MIIFGTTILQSSKLMSLVKTGYQLILFHWQPSTSDEGFPMPKPMTVNTALHNCATCDHTNQGNGFVQWEANLKKKQLILSLKVLEQTDWWKNLQQKDRSGPVWIIF